MIAALAAWMLEQVAEDERVAGAAEPEHPRLWDRFSGEGFDEHITRWQPRRVLIGCEATRRIIELHTIAPDDPYIDCPTCVDSGQRDLRADHPPGEPLPTCDTLRLLALPYADRPGYREEWRP